MGTRRTSVLTKAWVFQSGFCQFSGWECIFAKIQRIRLGFPWELYSLEQMCCFWLGHMSVKFHALTLMGSSYRCENNGVRRHCTCQFSSSHYSDRKFGVCFLTFRKRKVKGKYRVPFIKIEIHFMHSLHSYEQCVCICWCDFFLTSPY